MNTMNNIFKKFGREKKNILPKDPEKDIIDLCEDQDNETVESFSSSSFGLESATSVKRSRKELGQNVIGSENNHTRRTRNLSQTSFISKYHRNDLVGGSGTGFGGILLQPNKVPPVEDNVAMKSRSLSREPKIYKRKKYGGKRNRKAKKKNKYSNKSSESRQSAWSNREMRVAPYHDSSRLNGGGKNQYMQISTLDPALRNVGGAQITFS